jgi:cytochrome bd-type quinol oxidase subunit 2
VAPREADRDVMMASLEPVWDGNETWLVMGGALLGASWLIWRTEGATQVFAREIAHAALLLTAAMMVLVSGWTAIMPPEVTARWFAWPNVAWLAGVGRIRRGRTLRARLQLDRHENRSAPITRSHAVLRSGPRLSGMPNINLKSKKLRRRRMAAASGGGVRAPGRGNLCRAFHAPVMT